MKIFLNLQTFQYNTLTESFCTEYNGTTPHDKSCLYFFLFQRPKCILLILSEKQQWKKPKLSAEMSCKPPCGLQILKISHPRKHCSLPASYMKTRLHESQRQVLPHPFPVVCKEKVLLLFFTYLTGSNSY